MSDCESSEIELVAGMFSALRSGDTAQIDECLSKYSSAINSKNDDGSTPLLAVMDYGTKFLIPHLLKFSPDLTLSNKHGENPLHKAALFGDVEVVSMLLAAGASVNINERTNPPGGSPSSTVTALHIAAACDHKDVIEALMAAGADSNIKAGNENMTPMELAVHYNNSSAITAFDPTYVPAPYVPPEPTMNTSTEFDLPNSGPEHFKGERAMLRAAVAGDLAAVKRLTKAFHPVVYATDPLYGRSPVFLAALAGHLEVVKWLIWHGADIGYDDKVGNLVVHALACTGNIPILNEVLIAIQGLVTVIDKKNKFGFTPLHFAAYSGHVAAVKLLIKSGSNPSSTDLMGKSVMEFATERGHTAVVSVLTRAIAAAAAAAENLKLQEEAAAAAAAAEPPPAATTISSPPTKGKPSHSSPRSQQQQQKTKAAGSAGHGSGDASKTSATAKKH